MVLGAVELQASLAWAAWVARGALLVPGAQHPQAFLVLGAEHLQAFLVQVVAQWC